MPDGIKALGKVCL